MSRYKVAREVIVAVGIETTSKDLTWLDLDDFYKEPITTPYIYRDYFNNSKIRRSMKWNLQDATVYGYIDGSAEIVFDGHKIECQVRQTLQGYVFYKTRKNGH